MNIRETFESLSNKQLNEDERNIKAIPKLWAKHLGYGDGYKLEEIGSGLTNLVKIKNLLRKHSNVFVTLESKPFAVVFDSKGVVARAEAIVRGTEESWTWPITMSKVETFGSMDDAGRRSSAVIDTIKTLPNYDEKMNDVNVDIYRIIKDESKQPEEKAPAEKETKSEPEVPTVSEASTDEKKNS